MIEIKNILLPTDFSEPANYSLKYGMSLASKFKATLHVIHVAEHARAGSAGEAVDYLVPDHIAALESKDRLRLEELVQRICAEGVDARAIFVAGRAYQDIVKCARDLDVDLIVLATHGRTGFSHLVFGSTAEKVIRLASCPVITVKLPVPDALRAQAS
ncbi:MAG: universal stress protein [Acidobacteriota bacterium]